MLTAERVSTEAAYTPQGTVLPHSEMVLAVERSARRRILSGFPGFTASCIVLRAKGRGDEAMFPDWSNRSWEARSAEAKTSTGAPDWIWVTSAVLEAKLKRIFARGLARRNSLPSWLKLSVNDAAADTTISPSSDFARAPVGTHSAPINSNRPQMDRATLIVSMRLLDLSLIDQVVLALVVEEPQHGFGIFASIQRDDALSMAISVRRPLVYRSLNELEGSTFITPARTEKGKRGAPRTIYRATPKGRRTADAWLNSIVTHPRDARLELLAKFALRARRDMPNRQLARNQRKHFESLATSLAPTTATTPTAELVRKWRYESINAMIGLLHELERT